MQRPNAASAALNSLSAHLIHFPDIKKAKAIAPVENGQTAKRRTSVRPGANPPNIVGKSVLMRKGMMF